MMQNPMAVAMAIFWNSEKKKERKLNIKNIYWTKLTQQYIKLEYTQYYFVLSGIGIH